MKTPENAVSVQLESKPVLTVDDLKNTDHVGFVNQYKEKGYIVFIGNGQFKAIKQEGAGNSCNVSCGSEIYNSLKEAIPTGKSGISIAHEIYKFHTRRDLYKWLSEE